MLEVENLSPFTRAFHVDGKEYIFRAHQIRTDIPNSFLNPNGSIKYAGLIKLRKIIHDDGTSTRSYRLKTEEKINSHQDWEFLFEKDGKLTITVHLAKFCLENDLNDSSVRNYIKANKEYKGWKIARRKLEDKSVIQGLYSPDLLKIHDVLNSPNKLIMKDE